MAKAIRATKWQQSISAKELASVCLTKCTKLFKNIYTDHKLLTVNTDIYFFKTEKGQKEESVLLCQVLTKEMCLKPILKDGYILLSLKTQTDHSTIVDKFHKRDKKVIWCLFGMAPQQVVCSQVAWIWSVYV